MRNERAKNIDRGPLQDPEKTTGRSYLYTMRRIFGRIEYARSRRLQRHPSRLRPEREGNRVRLFTRNGHDWSGRYPWIVEAALKNRFKQFVN